MTNTILILSLAQIIVPALLGFVVIYARWRGW